MDQVTILLSEITVEFAVYSHAVISGGLSVYVSVHINNMVHRMMHCKIQHF